MPFIPTHFILVRNVRISANFSHNDQTFVANQFQTSASFGWGPFSVSGSYSEANSDAVANGSFDGASFTIGQPQIIAFTGFLLPMCPNPLPKAVLPWGDDAWLPDSSVPHDFQTLERVRLSDTAMLRADRLRLELIDQAVRDRVVDESMRQRRIKDLYAESLSQDLKANRGFRK
jgi:hypothetical protein